MSLATMPLQGIFSRHWFFAMNKKIRAVHITIIVLTLSMLSFAQTPAFITDPAQIKSKDKFDVQQLSVDKLFTTRNIGASTWSPDGKQIAFISNISGRNNIWLVSSESGWPTQLTVSDQRQVSPAWSPNGRWIAYGSDVDGNEQWDIYLVSPATGQVINLTNTPDVSEENFLWSPDSERLAYSVKPKQSPNYEIDIMEVATKKVTHLTSNTPADLNNAPAAWSRDGKWLVFNQSNAAGKNANIFLADAATGKSTNLTTHTGEKVYTATDISPDGKTVLLTSNAGNGYDNAALLDVASKKIAWLTDDKWEINTGQFSPDGQAFDVGQECRRKFGDCHLRSGQTRSSAPFPCRKASTRWQDQTLHFQARAARFAFAPESQWSQRAQRHMG